MIKEIIFAFATGWVITSWLSLGCLILKKLKWLNYICQKCLTFWLSIFYFTINNYPTQDIIMIAATAAFLAHLYTTKIED